MNITSKAQIVFGFEASDEQVSQFFDNQEKFPNLSVYNDQDDSGQQIIGAIVAHKNTYYGFSEATPFQLLSSEKAQEISQIIENNFNQKPEYFLVASCY